MIFLPDGGVIDPETLINMGVPGMTVTDVIATNCATQHCVGCDVRWWGTADSVCWYCEKPTEERC